MLGAVPGDGVRGGSPTSTKGRFERWVLPGRDCKIFCRTRYWTFDEMEAKYEMCRELNRINTDEGHQLLASTQPDLIISIRYGKIIKDPIIAIPKYGVINLHSGLLPAYGGILSTLHALNANENEVGCTLHYIDSADIDTGAIINSGSIAVNSSRSLFWHVSQLYPIGMRMIVEAVQTIVHQGALSSYQQDSKQQGYFGLPEAQHFEQLSKRGIPVWEPDDLMPLYTQYLGQGVQQLFTKDNAL